MEEIGLHATLDRTLAEAADIGDVIAGVLVDARSDAASHEIRDVVDPRIDDLRGSAITALTRERPFATDLRVILAVIRSSEHLRRSAALVGHLHALFAALDRTTVPEVVSDAVDELHVTVGDHFRYAVAAFRSGDVDWAADVETTEARVDALASGVLEEGAAAWVGHHDEDAVRAIMACGLLGRFLERLGDHATALGREVAYIHPSSAPD